jgi:hypothetical protein
VNAASIVHSAAAFTLCNFLAQIRQRYIAAEFLYELVLPVLPATTQRSQTRRTVSPGYSSNVSEPFMPVVVLRQFVCRRIALGMLPRVTDPQSKID